MKLKANTYYHVFNHANGFEELFFEEQNYVYFLKKYHKYIDTIADTPVWCLMPNHFHVLIRIKSEEQLLKVFTQFTNYQELEDSKVLSKVFSNFFSCYSQSMNKVYRRRGSMFVKSFKKKEIDSPFYLRAIILYIHLNPVKHRFRKNATLWKWSSIHCFSKEAAALMLHVFGSKEACVEAHNMRIKNLIHQLDENYALEMLFS